ncbi:ABC-type multidrug transport system fused ATPase/permease subunit [Arthrobacter sp. UYP6]|uniref:DUF3099 domain-containing protein n=1 Tax=Arthrobacter sp. UYP6 TaxID=1756378 RepID=UPI00339A1D66
MNKESSRGVPVPRITDARTAHTDEMRARMIKYSVSMGIRLVCLFLLFFVHGWLLWVVIAGAVVLPYFAVIIANGGSDTRNMTASESMIDTLPPAAIEAPRPREAGEPEAPETAVLHGEIIDDDPADHHDDKAPPSA